MPELLEEIKIFTRDESRVHIRPRLWSNYNRIKNEMTSHQLITVPDYNWITISSNDPLGVVWSNYSASLNKMADSWCFEETKLLIALWREEAVQHELNTMHNKKLVWDKISQGMADRAYSRSTQQYRVKINILKQKYCKIRDGNKIYGNQR